MQAQVIKAYQVPEIRAVKITDYLAYGVDNLYPQRLIQTVCGTAKLCIETKAKFIEGNGFNDEKFYKAVVNRRGEQVDDILSAVCSDISFFKGVAALINYDLTFKPCSIEIIPFEKIRLGKPDDADFIGKIAVINRIDKMQNSFGIKRTKTEFFDVFNPDPKVVAAQIEAAGGITNYKGQIFYDFHATQGSRYYPKAIDDAILIDIQAETALKKSRKRDISTGFSAKTIVTKFGEANPDDETRDADKADLKEFVGEDGSTIYLEYASTKESASQIQSFQAPDASERYERDGNAVKNDIMEYFAIPKILYGREISGKLGTSQEFEQAVKYVQRMVVNNDQRLIERMFRRIFSVWTRDINPSKDFRIQNLTIEQAQEIASQTGATGTPAVSISQPVDDNKQGANT